MAGVLNLDVPNKPLSPDAEKKARRVRTLGILALTFAFFGLFTPFILGIVAFVTAKYAMRISRENLVPLEYENPAYWAYRLSLFGMILWIGIVIRSCR